MSEPKKRQHPSKEVIKTENSGQMSAEHKFCEEALERMYELLQTTQQLARIGGWECDIEGKSIIWTPETYRIHDFDPVNFQARNQELIDASIQCYLPSDRETILTAFNKCCEQGIPYDLEFPFITATGRHIWIRTIGRPVFENGSVARVSGNIIDITEQKRKDEALRVSEMKYRAIMDQASEMIYLHDMQGNILEVNQAAVTRTGYSAEELLKMSFLDLEPGARERLKDRSVEEDLKKIKHESLEVVHRRKDGTLYPVEVSAGKIQLGDREYILALIRDISARKKVEQALRDSEQHARALVSAIPDMIFQMDANGVFLNYKADLKDLYLRPEMFIGRPISEVMPAWFAELTMGKIRETLADRRIRIFEYELTIPDQAVELFECRMVPYSESEIVAIIRNISEQKKTERKLRESEANARAIMESTDDFIILLNREGTVLGTNEAHARRMHMTREEMLGKNAFDFLPAAIAEKRLTLIRQSLDTGKIIHGEDVRDGMYNEYVIYPIHYQNETTEKVGVFSRDVTLQRQTLEALRRSETRYRELNMMKDKFLSIIAHDLKNPFNAIIGFSDLLKDRIEAKDYQEVGRFAGIIHESSKRVLDLLTNLLEWSRSQTGKIEFNPEYFDITKLIYEVTSLMEDSAHQKSITILNTIPRKFIVNADSGMISTVVRNLISNAIKFTEPGGMITIEARKTATDLVVTIKDTGIGIQKEALEKLFRIGESYSTSGTAKEKGTGLGLILCKEFIDKHGGKIWAESLIGAGSAFSFSLPIH